jgi:hypothetical protein
MGLVDSCEMCAADISSKKIVTGACALYSKCVHGNGHVVNSCDVCLGQNVNLKRKVKGLG